jgi:hypothetical protein
MPPGDDDERDPETLSLGGVAYARVRVGEEKPPGESPCPGCGAYYFAFHAAGCEYEPCPACGGQLVACGCG